jgi:hypothetical protein
MPRDEIVEPVVIDAGQAVGPLKTQVSNAALIFASLSLAASVSQALRIRLRTPSSSNSPQICGGEALSAPINNSPAWRRDVPQSVEELATPAKAWTLIDQLAISTV